MRVAKLLVVLYDGSAVCEQLDFELVRDGPSVAGPSATGPSAAGGVGGGGGAGSGTKPGASWVKKAAARPSIPLDSVRIGYPKPPPFKYCKQHATHHTPHTTRHTQQATSNKQQAASNRQQATKQTKMNNQRMSEKDALEC
jgi:hypothetical protein